MSLPGLFIEYLVNGSFTLIWLLPLLFTSIPNLPRNDNAFLLLVPGIYVIGMLIDYLTNVLMRPFKHRIEAKIDKKYGIKPEQLNALVEKLAVHSPELLVRRDIYSSRDRIARGALLNEIIATILLISYFVNVQQISMAIGVGVVGVALMIMFYKMWAEYENRSYTHAIESMRAVKEIQHAKSKS